MRSGLMMAGFGVAVVLLTPAAARAQATIHAAPDGAPLDTEFTLTVDGKPAPIYDARIASNAEFARNSRFAYFDFAKPVQVAIRGKNITKAVVRPLSAGVKATVADNTIRLTLTRPGPYQVEINGDRWEHAFYLFTNLPETDPPAKDHPNVIYFGPGIHTPGTITLKTGQSLYIAGGAIVRGNVQAKNVQNIRILGRGILDGHDVTGRWLENAAFHARDCKNVEVRGIIVVDFPSWTLVPYCSDDVTFDNVKILTGRTGGTDGIDIVSCQRVTVNGCFIKSLDDCIAIKALPPAKGRPAKDITITRCVLWNAMAGAIEIGYETNCDEISNVLAKDCDILFSENGVAALTIHDSNYALVHDIRFENIRCEYGKFLLKEKGFMWGCVKPFEFRNVKGQWGGTDRRGIIRNVVVKDFHFVAGRPGESEIIATDAEHPIEDITFKNLRHGDKVITSAEQGKIRIGDNVRNVRFLAK